MFSKHLNISVFRSQKQKQHLSDMTGAALYFE
jgi:hypothetical protein